jgi:hypothetical protein
MVAGPLLGAYMKYREFETMTLTIAFALTIPAFLMQLHASAYHRGLMSVARDWRLFRPEGDRMSLAEELRFVTPPSARRTSGLAAVSMLTASVIGAIALEEWWWGGVWLAACGVAANLVSRIILPGARSDVWTTKVRDHAASSAHAANAIGKPFLAERYEALEAEMDERL